ncbi:MAG: hypothetical protein ACI8T1_001879 [Verrucomicrobiales bacterium]|jgi:hypothetical protein
MGITNTQDYFTKRRTQLRVERYLSRLHQQPIMTQTRRARFEAVEHKGNALGHGLGLEFYDCEAARRGIPDADRPENLPLAVVLEAHS